MSILGRIAKGLGTAALTGNLGAGLIAAGTNSFTLGTMLGISDNLVNGAAINRGFNNYMPQMAGPSAYDMGVAMTSMMNGGPSAYDMGVAMTSMMNRGPSAYDMGVAMTSMTNGGPSAYDMGVAMTNMGFSPFNTNNSFSYNPMGYNMWTNPAIMW